jgi:hypothetical protein
MHVNPNNTGLQGGFFNATHSVNGKITVLYCGLVEIVRLSHPFAVVVVNSSRIS